ncbi:RidA family protein [Natronolimnohabitans sp. A-GB9]|uniref:RidA family protein n=1 Tax=Natronolimnohabitans sp. A-GB9 TaxID=3069757 RepID=UPI0027AE6673|nr:RidA family protein [Natronolimnohabitans sp. A-GB9]MDQ2052664.1 RidA family protein [Natronolimnohabitans sp. A-GB9]
MGEPVNEKSSRTALSSESKSQREGSKHTGAFGKRTGHSDLVFLEGILPETDGEILSDCSIEAQAETSFDRLEAVLAARGLDLQDVMKVEVQLTDLATRDVVDGVYQSRFDGEYPPRTTIGVCSLPGGAAVQLDVIAASE